MSMKEEELLLKFGNHIKKIRLERKLSQENLASLSNLDRTYISGVERGKRNISLVNIVKLALALGVPPERLLVFNQEDNT